MIAGSFLVHMMAKAVHHLHMNLMIRTLAIGFVAVMTTVAGDIVKNISKFNVDGKVL